MSLFMVALPSIPMVTLLLQRKHLLMALLSLEAISLMLALIIILLLPSQFPPALISLTFGACEASIGLALMVLMARQYGNDLLSSLLINKW